MPKPEKPKKTRFLTLASHGMLEWWANKTGFSSAEEKTVSIGVTSKLIRGDVFYCAADGRRAARLNTGGFHR